MAKAFKSIAKYIRRNSESVEAGVLRDLCQALEDNTPFELGRIYSMRNKAFELSMQLLDEWRFDQHVGSRRLKNYMNDDSE